MKPVSPTRIITRLCTYPTHHTILACIAITTICLLISACHDKNADNESQRGHELVAESKAFYHSGDFNSALSTLHRYLNLVSDDDNSRNADDIINTYIMLGNIHLAFNDYVRAASYYEDGLQASRELGSPDNEMKFLNDLAIVSCYLGNKDNALKYNEMLSDIKPKDRNLQRYLSLITAAYIEKCFGKHNVALRKLQESLHFIDSTKIEPQLKLSSYSEISDIYEKQNKLDSSLKYLKLAETLAYNTNANDQLSENKRSLMRIYTKLEDSDMSLRYQEEYFAHTDSIMNHKQFLNMSSHFQKANEDKAGLLIKNLRQTVNNQQMFLVITIFSILLLASWIFHRNKTKTSNIQLFKRNKELAEIEDKMRRIEEHRRAVPAKEATTQGDIQDNLTQETPAEADKTETECPEPNESAETSNANRQDLYYTLLEIMDLQAPYCDPEFSLVKLAKLADSNTKYVSQTINDFTGKNFRTFINEYRIREARRRLLDTENYGNMTIQYLAESIGFLSTSAFNMAFRKFTGMTPSLFKKIGNDMSQDSFC